MNALLAETALRLLLLIVSEYSKHQHHQTGRTQQPCADHKDESSLH